MNNSRLVNSEFLELSGLEVLSKDKLIFKVKSLASITEQIKADPATMSNKLLDPELVLIAHGRILTCTHETIKRYFKKDELIKLFKIYRNLIKLKEGTAPKFEMVTLNAIEEIK